MSWKILISNEFEAWFQTLPEKSQEAIAVDLEVLRDQGPQLGRPYVDQIKNSQFANMKELRTRSGSHVYRSLFVFDLERQAVILIGGDKRGKSQQKFYRQLIAQADAILARHLERQQRRKKP
jgi:hypothetical protein